MKLYVAYGSNMDEAQMEVRCPDSKSMIVVKRIGSGSSMRIPWY